MRLSDSIAEVGKVKQQLQESTKNYQQVERERDGHRSEAMKLQSQLMDAKASIDVERKLQNDIENECNHLKQQIEQIKEQHAQAILELGQQVGDALDTDQPQQKVSQQSAASS